MSIFDLNKRYNIVLKENCSIYNIFTIRVLCIKCLIKKLTLQKFEEYWSFKENIKLSAKFTSLKNRRQKIWQETKG